MRCSKCGRDNREGRRFCAACGALLVVTCPKCGATNQPDERFCGECGTVLGDIAPAAAAGTAPVTASVGGERRHLTVLFCDLVGSTEIATRLDPEEWRETVGNYHRAAAEAIIRYGGHVAQYLGDGVMAFFGYPQAHDNDAERATRAGLELLDAIAKLGEQAGRPKLTARVGVDSGMVVVGAGADKEADVFGEAPNIAARVQAAAEPGTVLITEAVHRLVSGLFVVESRGASMLKGIERPLQLYRVARLSGVRGRLEAVAAVRGLTPFVGREDELRLLQSRWERALEGEGQVVLVIGEAGIGKSRLLQRFHEQVPAPYQWLEAPAAPYFQHTPFHAIAELLRQLVGEASLPTTNAQVARTIASDGKAQFDTNERVAQLESVLVMAGLKPAEAIPLIAPLLNLPAAAKYPPPPFPPEQQRRRLLAMLVEWVLGAARVQPLIIALEDLHWADASTLEVIQLLAEQGAMAHLLLLGTARPESHPQWPLQAHHTQINLNRLSARNVREMIAQIAARHALADETVETVIERTGGVPLFVEELTRVVLESGVAKLSGHEIPVTLHDSLMARLDRLGSAKEVIQIGAVIGGEFSYELLHAIHPVGEEELQAALRSATNAELVYARGIAPEVTYQFKHAMIQKAAYEALLKSRRKELHRLVARTLNEKFSAFSEAHPEVLAHHWTDAGETELAFVEWSRAGKAAEARGAFNEALRSYHQALELLNQLPGSAQRDPRELELRLSIAWILWMTGGPSALDTIEATARVTALAEKSGNLALVVGLMVKSGLSTLLSLRDIGAIATLADQALELAFREGSPSSLLQAHSLQIQVLQFRGDFAGIEEHFAAEMKIADDPEIRQNYSGILMQDFAAAASSAWTLGRLDLARTRFAEMIAITNANNSYEVTGSRLLAAEFQFMLRKYEQAEAFATQALELSQKHQFAHMAAASKCALGKALIPLGRAAEGVDLLRQGIASLLEIGMHLPTFLNRIWLALSQMAAGTIVEAMETIEQTLQASPREFVLVPVMLLVRGQLRMKEGHSDLAEADFREALAQVRSMGAKMLELYVIMSLAQLLAQQQRRDEACTMLAEIYNCFTEGFDTADLKEAKALLDELAT